MYIIIKYICYYKRRVEPNKRVDRKKDEGDVVTFAERWVSLFSNQDNKREADSDTFQFLVG